MRSRVLLALAAVALALVPVASAAEVGIGMDRTHLTTSLGRDFSFTSTVANRGTGPTDTLVAHLNVLSLKPGVYVDPEDWSEDRTHYLDPIPPGGSQTVRWTVKAVNSGSLAAYVTVVSQSGAGTPTTGPTLRFDVASEKTLNAGGILPIALGVPGGIALLALGIRVHVRRRGR